MGFGLALVDVEMENRWTKPTLLLLLVLFLLRVVQSIGANDSGKAVFFLFLPFRCCFLVF